MRAGVVAAHDLRDLEVSRAMRCMSQLPLEFITMFRCALLISLIGAAGAAVAEPLTFDGALDLATRSSPDIAVRTASVEAARSASVAAGRLPDPKLTFGVQDLPVTGQKQWSLTRDDFTMRKIGVMQDVPNSAADHPWYGRTSWGRFPAR
jgi:hypothetical protein